MHANEKPSNSNGLERLARLPISSATGTFKLNLTDPPAR
jgi:hypothetical protein